ncbi:MAG: dienelactone hydrolase family protein [Acidimicrobiaceae bacterium]|nr:dienelactone hydrolase family protein [Acidimicrobiaceae bacterium]MXW96986.1 dienelactone hydrolase family protein [Acidimicrobiaceae bacterium]
MSLLEVQESILETVSDGEPLAVPRMRPASGGPHPLIVMFMDKPGIRETLRAFGCRLAANGYDVVLPDLYHRHGRMIGYSPAELAANPGAQDQLMTLMMSLSDDGIQNDLDAALAAVSADRPAGSVASAGCIGFCLGARAVFRTMMRLPDQFKAGAMWHPSFLVDGEPDSPHLTAGGLAGSLYAGFGEADRMMSVASMQPFIQAVSALGDRVTIDILPGADHAYTWPNAPTYNEAAAERAWSQTLALFGGVLGPARG